MASQVAEDRKGGAPPRRPPVGRGVPPAGTRARRAGRVARIARWRPGRRDRERQPRRPGRRWRRRRVAAVALVLAVVAAAGSALSWRWFVRPAVDGPVPADAIVMFGGSGPRFERAVALAEEGWADVVVLSDPVDPDVSYTALGWFCRNDGARPGYPVHDYEAICFDPATDTTRGEARYVAELARRRGWDRINLVTSVDQATRARMLVARCWDGEVATVTVPSDEPLLYRVTYEWGAMARAAIQRRGC